MKLAPYSSPKVPSHAGEHIALLFLGLIVILSALIGYEIFRMGRFDQASSVAAMQGVLALVALGAWVLLRQGRIRAERRKAEFFESLRNG